MLVAVGFLTGASIRCRQSLWVVMFPLLYQHDQCNMMHADAIAWTWTDLDRQAHAPHAKVRLCPLDTHAKLCLKLQQLGQGLLSCDSGQSISCMYLSRVLCTLVTSLLQNDQAHVYRHVRSLWSVSSIA
jgi:hypothetical protein